MNYLEPLSTPETNRLAELETTIHAGLKTFVDVGNALLEIRDNRLYRADHATFEAYCRDRWGMSRIHAHRMIEAAGVADNLLPMGNIPASERQARPLTTLEPDQQREAWQRAVDTAPNGRLTAAHVQNVVDEIKAAPAMRTFDNGMPALDLPIAAPVDFEWEAEDLARETDVEERWDACAVCRHNVRVKVDGDYRNICAATQTNLDVYVEHDTSGYPPCYDEDADTLAHFQMPDTDDTVAWEDVKDELLADKPERPKSLAAANHAISDDPDYDGDEWYTPLEFIAAARCVLGDIDLDPASSDEAQTVVQAARYATKEDDSLRPDYPWAGRVWMNPPYSMPLIRQFVARIIDEYDAGNVTEAIVLTNNSSDTQWFHSLLSRFPACFTRGRIYFWRKEPDNNFSTRQGQTLFYLGPNRDAFAREFAGIGLVVECTNAQPQD